jgi:hypothetical protein
MKRWLFSLLLPAVWALGQHTPMPTPPDLQFDSVSDPKRIERGKLFNFSGRPIPLAVTDTTDHQSVSFVNMQPLPELPIGESDTIAVGTVADVKVFVSDNKKALYTEYTFNVSQLLKPDGRLPSEPAMSLAIVRLGGFAKRPSGGLIRHLVKGYGPEPKLGSQYLMFLKYISPPADVYSIFKFWEVRDGLLVAAFDDDLLRVKQLRSDVNDRTMVEVARTIERGAR